MKERFTSMAWQLRHEGSPQVLKDLSLQQIADLLEFLSTLR